MELTRFYKWGPWSLDNFPRHPWLGWGMATAYSAIRKRRPWALALRETIRYNDTNYLNKQYFTVLMKTVLLYEVNWHNYLLKLQKLLS